MSQPDASPPAAAGSACRVCRDTGVMTWTQPTQLPGGQWETREVSHPCTCEAARAAGIWRHPAAERGHVFDNVEGSQLPEGQPATTGGVPPWLQGP